MEEKTFEKVENQVREIERKLGKSKVDKIILGMIFILIVAVAYNVFLFTTEGGKCVSNPLIYGAGALQDANNNAEVSCRCSIHKPGEITSGLLTFDPEQSHLGVG